MLRAYLWLPSHPSAFLPIMLCFRAKVVHATCGISDNVGKKIGKGSIGVVTQARCLPSCQLTDSGNPSELPTCKGAISDIPSLWREEVDVLPTNRRQIQARLLLPMLGPESLRHSLSVSPRSIPPLLLYRASF
jgi:hypothetical protein